MLRIDVLARTECATPTASSAIFLRRTRNGVLARRLKPENQTLREVQKMRLSEIRLTLLQQHEVLRRSLAELEELAEAVTHEGTGTGALRLSAAAFAQSFLEHIDFEQDSLEPLLDDIDAWGPQRLARLREEHGHQRALLISFQLRLETITSPGRLGELAQALVSAVFVDMEHEERELLTDALFRDDVISIDQIAG